jgi:hypothetical protein
MEVLRSTEASHTGRWAKRVTASETGEQSCVICLAQAVLSQLLALRRCNELMPTFSRIDASQTDYWHLSLTIIKGWVSDIIGDLGYSNTKPTEKPHFRGCWHILKRRERPSYPGLLQHIKRQSMEWHQPQSPRKKIQNLSVSGQGHDHCLLGLWRCYSYGCDAEMEDSQHRSLH